MHSIARILYELPIFLQTAQHFKTKISILTDLKYEIEDFSLISTSESGNKKEKMGPQAPLICAKLGHG